MEQVAPFAERASTLEAPGGDRNDGSSTRRLAMSIRPKSGERSDKIVNVASETPVALVYNKVPHAVMMATPANLEDFGLGFSISEGIVDGPQELKAIEVVRGCLGIQVHMRIPASRLAALRHRQRALPGLSGCGLCGIQDLDQLFRPLPRLQEGPVISPNAIHGALRAISCAQPLNQATGAAHAAAWCDLEGNILCAREDVGRHNALDKLVGAVVRAEIDPGSGFTLMTSRCSFELVQKAVSAGIRILVAISAPTGLALELAERSGLTLIALARADSLTIYAHPDRASI